ncbi:MAG TPA: hypothetical protein VGJ29_18415 [Vicinamibacterales bacterium]
MTDLLALLQELYRDKLTAMLRHQVGARLIGQYDINNTYQYVINREDVELSWVSQAITELGGALPQVAEPERPQPGSGSERSDRILEEDARDAQAFVDRWAPRAEGMTNARHAKMLRVILGETLEQKRFFEQARAGQLDLLGRRPDHVGPRVGSVLPTRWIE